MYFELALCAYLIDSYFGELPGKHPVMLMGDYIAAFERHFYRNSVAVGTLLVFSLLGLTLSVSLILEWLCALFPDAVNLSLSALVASTGIAMNLLHRSVADVLTSNNPKQAISYLVSRDTEQMTDSDIYKAALETWAENLSDGVIAPLFYLLLFGLPGIALYKAINTLDSMIAYKTERYYYFGKTAAYLDDAANYLPARLTALFIVLAAPDKALAWQCLWRDGNKLESPNAGYPIAAIAGGLGVALGGVARYHGQLKQKPVLGVPRQAISAETVWQGLAIKSRLDFFILSLLTFGAIVW